jgi:hypothetical protein
MRTSILSFVSNLFRLGLLQVSCFIIRLFDNKTYFYCSAVAQIVVQVPVGNNIVHKIKFPSDILWNDFLDHIYAAMSLDRQKDELGWKTCDETDRAANHPLTSFSDVDDAIQTVLNIQNNLCRRKPVFLKVTHLVSWYESLYDSES